MSSCRRAATALSLFTLLLALAATVPASASPFLDAVTQFADQALDRGRDVYGETHTPLFADGLQADSLTPVRWKYDGESWICSNLASQQNFFRTLCGLTALTGEARYKQAAMDAVAYHFDHLCRDCGLLQWGGHRFIDLETEQVVGEQDTHELKWSFPFYELLWEVNPEATARYIKAFWNAHILDWSVLDMNRHGKYGQAMGALWENAYEGGEPFFPARGLTFLNAGSDLMYAGTILYVLGGDEGARDWSLRLMKRYVDARHPFTQLGAYQYSQLTDYNDRALRQFGPDLPGHLVLEGTMLVGDGIYSYGGASQMHMAALLGEGGKEMLEWVREGLVACAKHAYDPETNLLTPMLTDGTPLTDLTVNRAGYYGKDIAAASEADSLLFLAYARGCRLTGDPLLWETTRHMARHRGLGDLGEAPGVNGAVSLTTSASDPLLLLGLLELMQVAPTDDYRELALRLGGNLLEQRFHGGFFLPSPEHLNACFDAVEPLALLTLEAFLNGRPDAVPVWPGGRGYIHGPHDGMGRTTDAAAIWSQKRAQR